MLRNNLVNDGCWTKWPEEWVKEKNWVSTIFTLEMETRSAAWRGSRNFFKMEGRDFNILTGLQKRTRLKTKGRNIKTKNKKKSKKMSISGRSGLAMKKYFLLRNWWIHRCRDRTGKFEEIHASIFPMNEEADHLLKNWVRIGKLEISGICLTCQPVKHLVAGPACLISFLFST